MDKAKFYKQVPSSGKLRDDFYKFIEEKSEFQGFIKIGKSSRQNLTTRYSTIDKYEQLSANNVFCLCASQEIALEVESKGKELSKEMGTFIWRSDKGAGALGREDNDYLVYITTLKPNVFKCPLESCPVVMTEEGIESHKVSHKFIADTIQLNRLLATMSIEPMSTCFKPIPVSFHSLTSLN